MTTTAVAVPRSVAVVIEKIRQTGMCNMLDRPCVQRQALCMEEHAALVWLEDHAHEYSRMIFCGMTLIEDGSRR